MNTKTRYQAAVRKIRSHGIKYRFNVMACCRGCISPEQIGVASDYQPYAYSYGGQEQRIKWDEAGNAYQGNKNSRRSRFTASNVHESPTLYLNHGNDSAQVLVEAFENQGFEVEWNGQDYECVSVRLV